MKILAAIPMKSSLNEHLRERMWANATKMKNQHPVNIDLAIYENEPAEAVPDRDHPDYVMARSRNLAAARNALLDRYLTNDFDYVLWIDADIVAYAPSLGLDLIAETDERAIIAPTLLIEGTSVYYDTFTHIDADGIQAKAAFPYFEDRRRMVPMSCVGGCYIAPADIYKNERYKPSPGAGMEHLTLMQYAIQNGYSIYVSRANRVYHANLPAWGEAYH